MEFREFSAKTVSDCITDACTTFSVPSDRLEYEVVTEGSSGFMGIGAKLATIKARVKEESFEEVAEARKKVKEVEDEKKAAAKKEKEERKEKEKAEKKANKEALKEAKKELSSEKVSVEEVKEVPVKENKKPRRELTEEEINDVSAKAVKFLNDVFSSMGMTVEVTCKYNLLDDCFIIDLAGDRMGILIGKRGQTLDSLQYLTSLVVNKGTSEYIRVKVDTENYRERRKETLENLAKNIAFKVKRTRRPISLEPMNPYERRIIHSALQSDRYVTTHSEGEEPFRKVVVTLKR
ncbi:MAG: Jag N-terminal domain-containing protein [Lachnospiraceae bacterium]|nr:Jag N-terminal domain-containing protein [Lachnospiraceae bacterium]